MQGLELILGVALLVVGYLWFSARGDAAAWKAQAEAKAPAKAAAPAPVAKAEAKAPKEPKQTDELAEVRKQMESLRKQMAAKENEAKDAREALKGAKEKAHQSTKQAEGLAKSVRELHEKIASAGPVDKLLAQNAELKQLVKEAQSRASGSAEPKIVEKIVEKIVTLSDSEAVSQLQEAHQREIADLRKAADGRRTGEAGLREERERVKTELEGLRKKLTKALNDVDRERRRADHNDKAYLIMKNQLEAALDRAAHVDLSLRRPDALYPGEVVAPRPKRERPVAEAVAPAAIAAPVAEAVAPAIAEPAAEVVAPAEEVAVEAVAEVAALAEEVAVEAVAEVAAPAEEVAVEAAAEVAAPAEEEAVEAAAEVAAPAEEVAAEAAAEPEAEVVAEVAAPAEEVAVEAVAEAAAEAEDDEEVADLSDDLADDDEEEVPATEESSGTKTFMMTGLDLDAAIAAAESKKS